MAEVKVVIGANYGDEGKGLVSANLARTAQKEHKSCLTIFYNGTVQRAHSYGNTIRHCTATGEQFGSDTYYHKMFVVDPIALWVANIKNVYIDPSCRLILPCDVAANRNKETARGKDRHGSCGFGLFEAVKRSETNCFRAEEMNSPFDIYKRMKFADQNYGNLYNMDNFMRAIAWVMSNNTITSFSDLMAKKQYDVIIYEGGQGLLLGQQNRGDFPHLTPSSTGTFNLMGDKFDSTPELYYVSRTYMTRHGAGPMEAECTKEDINPKIIDKVNHPNEWQGSLRFGHLDIDTLYQRVQNDSLYLPVKPKINLVFTQLNYTDGKLDTTKGRIDIEKPDFCDKIFVSNNKYDIFDFA